MSIDNPPAFPPHGASFDYEGVQTGMSLRDWFAGQALPSTFSFASSRVTEGTDMGYLPEEWAAKIAYGLADAMLQARKQDQ